VCHANGIADRDVRRDRAGDGVTMPVTTMGPHAAAMGLKDEDLADLAHFLAHFRP
jgi:cytochrome c553